MRDVLTVPTEPFPGAHFATYPRALVRPFVKAGTSEWGCCPACGKCWEREVETTYGEDHSSRRHIAGGDKVAGVGWEGVSRRAAVSKATTNWWPGCRCVAGEPVPCTVLDPFAGAGTTLLVAAQLDRAAVGIELNADYADMAWKRINQEWDGVALWEAMA